MSATRARLTWPPMTVTVDLLASPPLVALLDEAQLDQRLGRADALDGCESVGEDAQQVLVVLAHDLAEQVVPAGGDHDVRHLLQLGDLLRDAVKPPRIHLEADERGLLEAHG